MAAAELPTTGVRRSTFEEDTTDVEREDGSAKPHDEKTAAKTGPRDQEDRAGPDQDPASTARPPAAAAAEAGTDSPESGRKGIETFLVMFALCLALFLAALDMTILATAIPTISSHFDSSLGYVTAQHRHTPLHT
ncbi:hypothetical protein HRG_001536 [Hirsutella rhossiliensis]|uniref:Major facilitator superfamily transporter n=1 Tax=Hirsutella rhossiliensis TaxID=111463 RepID=A0A9P8NAW4_9HYPO|nr:uncharacterized protein HRG_01536 [Hirsutella rhossiliensis]KAH0968894.1 hypothetical protein HRG_01536 [Hirsutella rhossiliensis]